MVDRWKEPQRLWVNAEAKTERTDVTFIGGLIHQTAWRLTQDFSQIFGSTLHMEFGADIWWKFGYPH